jgi:hypothetical protein
MSGSIFPLTEYSYFLFLLLCTCGHDNVVLHVMKVIIYIYIYIYIYIFVRDRVYSPILDIGTSHLYWGVLPFPSFFMQNYEEP